MGEILNAGLNQVQNDRYIVIDKLLVIYKEKEAYLDAVEFKEKKKYLKKLTMEKAVSTLHKYIKTIMENGYTEISDEEMLSYYENPSEDQRKYIEEVESYNQSLIQKVRWFLFYLVYDANKIDIFMIHSILGYKYDGALKVYQKLFFKDHNTGKNEKFLHHINILNISENSLFNRKYEKEYDRRLIEVIKHKKLKKNQIKKDKTCQYILEDKMCEYKSTYEEILRNVIPIKEPKCKNGAKLIW